MSMWKEQEKMWTSGERAALENVQQPKRDLNHAANISPFFP
jgi:hypothetical protein